MEKARRTYKTLVAGGVVAAVAAVAVLALLVNIIERKTEAKNPFFRVVDLDDTVSDPAVWGKNFPLQYDAYKRTVDMVRTRFGGSEAVPRTPTQADPRSLVAQSRLEEDSRLKTMWAGNAFSRDFREERGHAFMLEDQTYSERQKAVSQPGACLQCHSSSYAATKKLGDGDIFKGFDAMNKMPFAEARKLVDHPVSCIDCHDPKTLDLRITRPAFLEGMRNLKKSEGIKGYDPNKTATRQEMRSFVCAQCHVEYYFKGPEKRLVFPWHKGLKVENILAYYDEVGHKDWVHKISSAPVLKVQHPEFELWSQGIHARAGVSCVDCHMPYERVGALKISDHHVRSPMLNINRACQTCHNEPESELKERVNIIQARTFKLRNSAMDAVVDLIADIEKAQKARAPAAVLDRARAKQRSAQFKVDFIEAENSMGFHAPQEAARILAESIDEARQGQLILRDPGYAPTLTKLEK